MWHCTKATDDKLRRPTARKRISSPPQCCYGIKQEVWHQRDSTSQIMTSNGMASTIPVNQEKLYFLHRCQIPEEALGDRLVHSLSSRLGIQAIAKAMDFEQSHSIICLIQVLYFHNQIFKLFQKANLLTYLKGPFFRG